MGCKQVWINMLGHKCIPDGLSIPDLLLCFSLFYPLCSPAIQRGFSKFSQLFSQNLLPPLSPSTPSLNILFFLVFLSCACPCLPSHPPSIATFPAALLLPYQIKWSLPTGNMTNRLNFTGHQESLLHLPCTSMGMQPFNSSASDSWRKASFIAFRSFIYWL